jgi:hypothetical protein
MGSVPAAVEDVASTSRRVTRSRPVVITPIEMANKKTDEEFIDEYLCPR